MANDDYVIPMDKNYVVLVEEIRRYFLVNATQDAIEKLNYLLKITYLRGRRDELLSLDPILD